MTFETILDEVCERLEGKCREGYFKRILKMEQTLDILNQELNEFVAGRLDKTSLE